MTACTDDLQTLHDQMRRMPQLRLRAPAA
jgi:hypothetical protein